MPCYNIPSRSTHNNSNSLSQTGRTASAFAVYHFFAEQVDCMTVTLQHHRSVQSQQVPLQHCLS